MLLLLGDIMPANVKKSWFGRVYFARNPSWTIHAESYGPRANGQIKGMKGIGNQTDQRVRFAAAGHATKGQTGKVPFMGVKMPKSAVLVAQSLGHKAVTRYREREVFE